MLKNLEANYYNESVLLFNLIPTEGADNKRSVCKRSNLWSVADFKSMLPTPALKLEEEGL